MSRNPLIIKGRRRGAFEGRVPVLRDKEANPDTRCVLYFRGISSFLHSRAFWYRVQIAVRALAALF
jgi:hypothetical protein